jgi:hypothetical protein
MVCQRVTMLRVAPISFAETPMELEGANCLVAAASHVPLQARIPSRCAVNPATPPLSQTKRKFAYMSYTIDYYLVYKVNILTLRPPAAHRR